MFTTNEEVYTFFKNEFERVYSNLKSLDEYKCACGSTSFEKGICKYCDFDDSDLRISIRKLDASLDRVFEGINEFGINTVDRENPYLNKLYELLISEKSLFPKDRIETLIKKLDYEKFLINNLSRKIKNKEKLNDFEINLTEKFNLRKEMIDPELIEKIKIDIELSKEDIENIERLLNLGFSKEGNIFFIANYVIRESLLNKKTFSYETLEKAFYQVATSFAKEESESAVVLVKDVIEYDEGSTSKGTRGLQYVIGNRQYVDIRRSLLIDLYNDGNPLIFEVLFHEINHIMQRKRNKKADVEYLKVTLIQVMDEIIYRYLPEYGQLNYPFLSHELESRIESYSRCQFYLQSLGVITDYSYDAFKRIEEETLKYQTDLRTIDEEEVDIDIFFTNYIRSLPRLLDDYPILKYKYKSNWYVVDLKSEDELKEDYADMMRNHDSFSEKINEFYDHLFEGLSKYKRYNEEKQKDIDIKK